MTGVGPLNPTAVTVFEAETRRYFEDFYNDPDMSSSTLPEEVFDVTAYITVTLQIPEYVPGGRRRNRHLQSDDTVDVVYEQNITYRSPTNETPYEDILDEPFNDQIRLSRYMSYLMTSSDFTSLENVTVAMYTPPPPPSPTSSGSMKEGKHISFAYVGSILCLELWWYLM